MFGKSIPLLAIIAIVMTAGIVGAALVDYLSNTVGTNFAVISPMLVGVSLGVDDDWAGASYPEGTHTLTDWTTSGTLTLPDVYGGGTMTVYLMSENLANGVIEGFEEAILTNTAGVTGEDFVSIVVSVDSIYGDLGYGTEVDIIDLGLGTGYFEVDGNTVRFGTAGISTWGEGETDVTKIVVTFEEAASGTYTLSYRVVPEGP